MEKDKCKCGKVIEGYGKNHVAFLMKQHKLACDTESNEKEVKEQ